MRKVLLIGLVVVLALTVYTASAATQDPSARSFSFNPLPTLELIPNLLPFGQGQVGIEAGAAKAQDVKAADDPTETETAEPSETATETETAEPPEETETPEPGAPAQTMVGVCHLTGSKTNPYVFITVAQPAVKAHEAHGDTVNVADASACPTTAPADGRPNHGQGNGQGNGQNHGQGNGQGNGQGVGPGNGQGQGQGKGKGSGD